MRRPLIVLFGSMIFAYPALLALGQGQLDKKDVEQIQKSAAQGDASAQCQLGIMYSDGRDVPRDAVKAAEWYQKAGAQGNAPAQDALGGMYVYGNGVPKDEAKAAEWYEKAATQGHAHAQRELWFMYEFGLGVPKNKTKAAEWQRKADAQLPPKNATQPLASTQPSGEDLTTINGKKYKGVTISSIEPDCLVVVTDSGIERINFVNLPKAIQEKYGYDPVKAAQYVARVQAANAHQVEVKAQQAAAFQAQWREGQRVREEIAIQEQRAAAVAKREADAAAEADAQAAEQHRIEQKELIAARNKEVKQKWEAEQASAQLNATLAGQQRAIQEMKQKQEQMQRDADWNKILEQQKRMEAAMHH